MKQTPTKLQIKYLRRLSIFDKLIETSLVMVDDWNHPKVNVDYMIDYLTSDVASLYLFRYEEGSYINDEYVELKEFLRDYLESKREEIKNIIDKNRK